MYSTYAPFSCRAIQPTMIASIMHTRLFFISVCEKGNAFKTCRRVVLKFSVASWCSTCLYCYVCISVFRPLCHGAVKLGKTTLLTSFFLWTSFQFIFNAYFIMLPGELLQTRAGTFQCRCATNRKCRTYTFIYHPSSVYLFSSAWRARNADIHLHLTIEWEQIKFSNNVVGSYCQPFLTRYVLAALAYRWCYLKKGMYCISCITMTLLWKVDLLVLNSIIK